MDDLSARIAALSPNQRMLFEALLKERHLALPDQEYVVEEPTDVIAIGVVPRSPALDLSIRDRHTPGSLSFSLFFFSDHGSDFHQSKYHLLFESTKFADRNGFCAVWTPERHFHEFGGPYPNPSVLSAALAMVTEQIQIRAGSVVLPLHHPVRVAEEWSVVDNLSGGRVGVSIASGWHPDDFVLARASYADRRAKMERGLRIVQQLWAGETILFRNESGNNILIQLFPKPLQPKLPLWITSSRNPETWIKAGELGTNVLTGLMEQTLEELAKKIALYRAALSRHGHDPQSGQVTVMLHTYIGADINCVREKVQRPFINYLRAHMGLYEKLLKSQDMQIDVDYLTEQDRTALLSLGFERYFNTSALMGTPSTCMQMVERLKAIGVTEIACLINFGLDFDSVMASLERLNELQARCTPSPFSQAVEIA